MFKKYVSDLKAEFKGYNGKKLTQDLMAGLTVAAVALPLALAFGVSSGADAASGLVTAIVAGIVIGILSGASYQISGPTGAMAAILLSVSAKYGITGVLTAGFLSGAILIIAAVCRVGKLPARSGHHRIHLGYRYNHRAGSDRQFLRHSFGGREPDSEDRLLFQRHRKL